MLLLVLPSPALLSSRQPRKSVSVTALWFCSEAESTSRRHSGLGTRQGTSPLAAHAKASTAGLLPSLPQPQGLPGWLRMAQAASLAILSPLRAAGLLGVPTAQGALQLPPACPQYTMAASLQGPEKSGRGASGAFCITATDSLLLLPPSLG